MVMEAVALMNVLEQLRRLPREAATVEFKSNWDHAEDIGEYLSALANAAALARHDRAWMVWGVENHTHDVKGTTFNPFSAKGEGNQPLVMWLTHLSSPRPDFQFHELVHPDGRVVMLEIHPPRTEPLSFKGVRYIRVDSHKVKLAEHPGKEARLWEVLTGGVDGTGQIVPDATFDDLDPEAIEFARLRFTEYLIKSEPDASRHEKIRTEAKGWDVSTLLNKARITKQGRITRSALLLLGRDEAAHFLAPADAKISWILRDANNHVTTSQHFSLPFLLSSGALFKRIRNVPVESPHYYISAKEADWVGQKARYIRNRALDDEYYRRLIVEYLQKFKRANRQELDDLLLSKLSEVLAPAQKQHKVRNLIQSLRRDGAIQNAGSKRSPAWELVDDEFIAKGQK